MSDTLSRSHLVRADLLNEEPTACPRITTKVDVPIRTHRLRGCARSPPVSPADVPAPPNRCHLAVSINSRILVPNLELELRCERTFYFYSRVTSWIPISILPKPSSACLKGPAELSGYECLIVELHQSVL